MPLRKILGLVCLMGTTFCLAVGDAMVGQWIALAAALIILLAWLLNFKWPSTWLPSAALVASVSLAAAGLSAGASPFLMMFGATLALANWDLVLLDQALAGSSSTKPVALLEKKHYQSLALALGLALLVTVTSRTIRFQIPFGGMLLLVILALFSLNRVWRTLVD